MSNHPLAVEFATQAHGAIPLTDRNVKILMHYQAWFERGAQSAWHLSHAAAMAWRDICGNNQASAAPARTEARS